MLTGFSKIKITPPTGVIMGGHPGEKRSTGNLTELYAKALAISDGGTLIVFASADVLFVGDDSISRVKEQVHGALIEDGTGAEHKVTEIYISATHTHSGPLTTELFGNTARNVYTTMLEEGLVSCIIGAVRNMSVSGLYHSEGFVTDMVFCARMIMKGKRVETHPFKDDPDIIAPEGIPDRQFHVLAAYDQNNVIKGMLVNFGQHPQIMERACTLISADFPAYLEDHLQKELGLDIPVLYVNGPCGDVCPVDAQNAGANETGLEWCRSYGEKLGEYVLGSIGKHTEVKGVITLRKRKMELRLRDIPDPVLMQAKSFLETEVLSEGSEDFRDYKVSDYGTENGNRNGISKRDPGILSLEKYLQTPEWKVQEYKDIIYLAELRSRSEYQRIELSVMIIGDLAVVTMPFEVFAEIGTDIKAGSRRKTAVFELTNGNAGYLPTAKAFGHQGGYETKTLFSSRFDEGAASVVTAEIADMLKEMDKEEI